jgi:glycosyltransferase involved in cell wall biosynthesis
MIDVVLPVLDEAFAIPWVLSRMPSGYHPIVVDNGSTDDSPNIARRHGAQVVVESRRGFGAACYAGLLASSSEVVCFMDCDGSLDPIELPRVSAAVASGESDLVLGRRVPDRSAWPVHSRIANRILAAEVSRRTKVRVRDLGPMRAAERRGLIGLTIEDRRSGWPLEMMLKAAAAGWRVTEVAVTYRSRSGRSKVTGTVGGTLRAVKDMAAVLR